MNSSITDVPGIRVGHAERRDAGWLTGVTVIVPPSGTIGAVDVRGGGPGTRETDALDPSTLVSTVDAVVLTGGSAYGLSAADGVQRWCEEQGRGYRVGDRPDGSPLVVPIVPAAAIFDLGRGGDPDARPDAAMGYQAAAGARSGDVARGNVGAGTGAAVARGMYRGGVGTASVAVRSGNDSGADSSVVVGALAVVNAFGSPVPGPLQAGPESDAVPHDPVIPASPQGPALNTTLVVVATNAALSPAEARRTATAAHAGLARAINPSHTLVDGDTVFVLSTGAVLLPEAGLQEMPGRSSERTAALLGLQCAAADAVGLAIADAVTAAAARNAPGVTLPAYPGV